MYTYSFYDNFHFAASLGGSIDESLMRRGPSTKNLAKWTVMIANRQYIETGGLMGEGMIKVTDETYTFCCLVTQVRDVHDLIMATPGCSQYANELARHEIDGPAAMLITTGDLISVGVKLGPALKIVAVIAALMQPRT